MHLLGSLANNQICGIDTFFKGTYTAVGLTKLCEGLKGSAVTSLKCAAAPSFCFVSAPHDTPASLSPYPLNSLLTVSIATTSEMRV